MCLRACTCISRVLANGFPLECSSRVASLMAGGHLSSALLICDRATRPGHYFSRSCFRSSPGRCPGVGAARLGRRRAVGFLSSAHGRTTFVLWEARESWNSSAIREASCFAISALRSKLSTIGAVLELRAVICTFVRSRGELHVRAMCRATSDHGCAMWRSGFSPDAIRNSTTVRLV